MRRKKPGAKLSHANALRRNLGLPPTPSPNASSDTVSELVGDMATGYSCFDRLVDLLRDPPKGGKAGAVRDFLGHVYEWANFAYGACLAFDREVQRERYGDESASRLIRSVQNITYELFGGLGVRLATMKVDPAAFETAARGWSPEEVDEAGRAVARARRRLREVVLAAMGKFLPEPLESRARAKLSPKAYRVWTYLDGKPYKPTYDEIERELHVSRTTISEAFKELRRHGLFGHAEGERDPVLK